MNKERPKKITKERERERERERCKFPVSDYMETRFQEKSFFSREKDRERERESEKERRASFKIKI